MANNPQFSGMQRAGATTDWKEFTSPDGRKYYYNKVTKQSKWLIPEELKLARKRVEQASIMGIHSETLANPHASTFVDPSVDKTPSSADTSSFTAQGAPLSPVPVIPVAAGGNLHSQSASEPSTLQAVSSSMTTNMDEVRTTVSPVVDVPTSVADAATVINAINVPMNTNSSAEELLSSADKIPAQEKQELEALALNCPNQESTGQDVPSHFLGLPDDLKLKILELLPSKGVARMECVCSELRDFSLTNCKLMIPKLMVDAKQSEATYELHIAKIWRIKEIVILRREREQSCSQRLPKQGTEKQNIVLCSVPSWNIGLKSSVPL